MPACSVCGAQMVALFTSSYCPNEDRKGGHGLSMELGGRRWRAQRVPAFTPIPDWATHGWHVDRESHVPSEDGRLADLELIERMREYFVDDERESPGWEFCPGDRNPKLGILMVFGPIAKPVA